MTSIVQLRSAKPSRFLAWLPFFVLPLLVISLATTWPPWVFVWALGFSVYVGIKWLTFASEDGVRKASLAKTLYYLFLWPGMDAKTYFNAPTAAAPPQPREWAYALGQTLLGGMLLWLAISLVDDRPFVAAWLMIVGIAFALNFGLLLISANVGRSLGWHTPPIMVNPFRATSLTEFWGKRWNLAFRDFAHAHIFRPVAARFGALKGMLSVFLVSGLLHDLVISLPVRGGFGLPTLYFMLQSVALLFEQSWLGKRLRLGRGWLGRIFCGLIILLPLPLLFHTPFFERAAIPMLRFLRGRLGE